MNPDDLKAAFVEIQKRFEFSEYLQNICSLLSEKNVSKDDINQILHNYGIPPSIAKVDFLHLIFEYIKIALEDDILTIAEKEDIKSLKRLFQIQPGDFYLYNKWHIEKVI